MVYGLGFRVWGFTLKVSAPKPLQLLATLDGAQTREHSRRRQVHRVMDVFVMMMTMMMMMMLLLLLLLLLMMMMLLLLMTMTGGLVLADEEIGDPLQQQSPAGLGFRVLGLGFGV
jgi:hypothetical protein